MQTLIRREIDTLKLPKKAISILHRCDRLISHYTRAGSEVRDIALYPDDYRYLSERLEANEQNIADVTYRGFGLRKAAV